MKLEPHVQSGTMWRHVKTGQVYHVKGEALNATNGHEEQILVIYERDIDKGQFYSVTFAREINEFLEKFEPVTAGGGA